MAKKPPPPASKPADLETLRAAQLRECSQELNSVLDRYGCALFGVPMLVPDGDGFKVKCRVDIGPRRA